MFLKKDDKNAFTFECGQPLKTCRIFPAAGLLEGVKLFATDHGSRRTVAILADQYLRLAPYKQLVEALQVAGRNVVLPPILPMPRLIESAREAAHPA